MNNQDYIQKGQEVILNTYARFPIAPVKGKGTHLWDADGKEYLDFLSGIAVCSLGHAPDALIPVLKEQAETLWHASNLYWLPKQVELAEKLVRLSGLSKAFFCNSGAEANEGAMKLARKYFYRKGEPERYEIIVFNHSFHGRTLGALAATMQPKYQTGYGPLPEGWLAADYNDLDSVRRLISSHTAAIMLEPIQGEGGIYPGTPEFMAGIQKLCDDNGLLLILDEVQCGMGRSGKFFAFKNYDLKPDIVTMAKALAGGMPIGAMVVSERAAAGFQPGDHASTFGGNPLVTAVACKNVEIISDETFLAQVNARSAQLMAGLRALNDPRLTEVRGMGLMIGVAFTEEVRPLVQLCMENGLLVGSAGGNVLRLVPPLNITAEEADAALDIIKTALAAWK